MSEGALPVAVAQSPDAGNARSQLIVHSDVSVLIRGDPSLFDAEIVGIRTPSNSQQYVRSDLFR